ncbi:MAG: bifunctional metallophosphatase/5'-nucleotidase [Bacteroidota bacterium]
MNHSLKYLLLSLVCIGLISCQPLKRLSQSDQWDQVNILHINDVYEISPLEGGKTGGMARVASLRKQLIEESPATITFLAGDFLSPSVIGTVKYEGKRIKGAQMVDAMNAAGVDYVCFGNHEFDIKEEELQQRIEESEFEWVAGNILHQTANGPVPFAKKNKELRPHLILEPIPGFKVGFISACLPANKQEFVHYDDIYASIKEDYKEIEPKVDMVLGLTHLSIRMDRKVAEQLPELELIMGGHEHKAHYEKVGDVPIAKADANAKSAYVHRIFVHKKTGKTKILSQLIPIDETIPLDEEVNKVVESWEEKAFQSFEEIGINLSEPVAKLETPLDGLEEHIRTEPTNLGIALAKSMLKGYDGLQGAIVNSGSVRLDDKLEGSITQYDIVRTLPFGGGVLKVDMKGSLLKQILETGELNKGAGGYLQLANLEKIEDTYWVAGQPLDEAAIYTVAISDFLMRGLEQNMAFLTRDNPAVVKVTEPTAQQKARDIRLLFVDYLKENF